MKLTCASIAVAFALTALIRQPALCADTVHRPARIFYRESAQADSKALELPVDRLSAYYVATDNSGPGQSLDPHRPDTLTFRISTTQGVQRIAIPIAAMKSIDLLWLPIPHSTIGFKSIRISGKDGGAHSIDAIVDGLEYRYVRTGKDGVVKQDLKGGLDFSISLPVPPAPGGYGSDVAYEWFAFCGIGPGKQRPHSPDNEWIIARELIDRIEFDEDVGTD